MSSPYYSPNRRQHQLPPGDGYGPDGYYTPERANASSSRMSPQQSRQGTGGPGNASQYYDTQQDGSPGVSAPAFGTGTDGFGGPDIYENPNGRGRHASPYAQGYNYEQRNDRSNDIATPRQYNQPTYLTPVYDNTPQGSSMTLPDENRRFQPPPAPYDPHYLHEYPPRHSFNTSPGPYDQRNYTHVMNRPDTPGFYLDRAPDMDKLNDAQKKIAKEFPKDLDDNEGSMMKSAVSSVKDWRTWIKWKYIRESFAS